MNRRRYTPTQTEESVAAREGKTIQQLREEHDEAVARNEKSEAEAGRLARARTVEEIRAARLAEEKLIAERWAAKRAARAGR